MPSPDDQKQPEANEPQPKTEPTIDSPSAFAKGPAKEEQPAQ